MLGKRFLLKLLVVVGEDGGGFRSLPWLTVTKEREEEERDVVLCCSSCVVVLWCLWTRQ